MTQDLKESAQRKLNFFQTLVAIACAMFGVRKGAGSQNDVARLNPVHLVVAGLLAGLIFVVGLVMIVRLAVSSLS